MSRTISRRLLAQSPFIVLIEPVLSFRLSLGCLRPFSNTTGRKAEGDEPRLTESSPTSQSSAAPFRSQATPLNSRRANNAVPASPSTGGGMADLANSFFSKMITANQSGRADRQRFDPYASSDGSLISSQIEEQAEAHHFHIYATRHNTHITVTRPDRSPMISVSAGNIGFRKAGRKHYDSAFQLASYVLGRMRESGMNVDIKRLEVVLRGFGAGREAVTKALLGTEGRFLRGKVVKVADATRLKFGGTRSKKPRRLG